MFDFKHYVPILRWKRAEWIALRELRSNDKILITPLFELVPKDFKKIAAGNNLLLPQILEQKVSEIAQNWGSSPFFLDLLHLNPNFETPDGKHPIEKIAAAARSRKLSLIPVTGLNRTKKYNSAIAEIANADGVGICYRIFLSEMKNASFETDLDVSLARLELKPEQVDLILDLQLVGEEIFDINKLGKRIPKLEYWRSFTVASGSFPKDLSALEKNKQYELPRFDWHNWQSQLSKTLLRKPSFGDYTIQHPFFSEPPSKPNYSASIRYTASTAWVVVRGEGVFNDKGPGFAQWPANAKLLCKRKEFCGSEFSYGDAYIKQMSLQSSTTGSAETWIRAGINHHLTFVAHQIGGLSDS